MKPDTEQITDILIASRTLHGRGSWKPGDPYMEDDLGNMRFIGWLDPFISQLRKICDNCPYQVQHPDLWWDEAHNQGVPANKLCAKYAGKIGSCYDTLQVAKVCGYIDQNVFGIYVKEYDAYCQWWKDKLQKDKTCES